MGVKIKTQKEKKVTSQFFPVWDEQIS